MSGTNDSMPTEAFHTERFIDTGDFSVFKHGNTVGGDTISFMKDRSTGRTTAVLADGLGSGIKAGVLSILTATMAGQFVSHRIDIRRAAKVITGSLPICSIRKMGYSTFTIIDMDLDGDTRIIEFDNPECLYFREGVHIPLERQQLEAESADGSRLLLHYSRISGMPGDRLVFMSDGITQAGLGNPSAEGEWGLEGAIGYVEKILTDSPSIDAHTLAKRLVRRAETMDGLKPKDDITAGVVYVRKPKRALVLTGPPFDPEKDTELHRISASFEGTKIVCGGTTAKIFAREAGLELRADTSDRYPGIPPGSKLEGFDLATEGTVTLAHLERLLREGVPEDRRRDKAVRLRKILLDHDIIEFVIGTRINEAHQDPNLPLELDIRRNTVRRICESLERIHMKETKIRYL